MSALKKPLSAFVGAIVVLLAGVFFAVQPAGAYPDGVSATIDVSTTTPSAGQTVGVDGANFQPNEAVSVEFHSVVVALGGVTADGSGAFSTSVTIPMGSSGSHEIVGTGLTSGEVAVAAIRVGGSSTGGGGGGSNGGGLSNTGVAVIGIGALGVVLLVGGGLLLMAGKRRKVSI